MHECDLETSVPDWIIDHPETLAVFEELGMDYSCGGKSLESACRERGLDAETVLGRLRWRIKRHRHKALQTSVPVVIVSVQVGMPRHYGQEGAEDPMDRPWTTGFWKEPIVGPLRLSTTNLDGDGQADRVHHGGSDKAVLAYSAHHYATWRETLGIPTLPYGAFGENFTVAGLTEMDVCIGDTWQVGDEVRVQVSQPRQPCWKLARRWRIKTLALQVQQTGWTGWYFRVLVEGLVAAGMPLKLVQRPHPEWTVELANRVMHAQPADLRRMAELAANPLLSASWRQTLVQQVEQDLHPDATRRLGGEDRK